MRSNFKLLEVVDRVSETQLHVIEYLILVGLKLDSKGFIQSPMSICVTRLDVVYLIKLTNKYQDHNLF